MPEPYALILAGGSGTIIIISSHSTLCHPTVLHV